MKVKLSEMQKAGLLQKVLIQVVLSILKGMSHAFLLQPRQLQLFWGKFLGAFFYLIKFRAKVIRRNLEIAYPHHPEKQKIYFRKAYEHLGHLVWEILISFGAMRKFVLKYVDFIGKEHIDRALFEKKGFFFLSSHLGNWEVMAAAGGIWGELNLMLVTKKIKPEWLFQALVKGRKECHVTATYEPKTVRDIFSQLKKNAAVGFVLDQYAGAPIGVRVPLFGIPVGTPLALAALTKRTGVPVLPVVNYRQPNGRWVVEISAPQAWIQNTDAHYELAENTAAYVATLETHILAHPEQWLWTHRRFKGDLSPLRDQEWREARARK